MDKSLTDNILHVCNTLNAHKVQYLIVGGTAVALHGYFRMSYKADGTYADKYDLDIWYNPTYGNYFNLLNALEELGQDVTEFKEEQAPDPHHSFFRFELEKFTLDFLPVIKGLSKFSLAFGKKEVVTLSGTDISFINFEDLIKDKEASSRPKDLIDIKQLKARTKEE